MSFCGSATFLSCKARIMRGLLALIAVVALCAAFVSGLSAQLGEKKQNSGGAKRAQKAKVAKGKAKRQPLIIPEVPRNELICFCLYTTHNSVLKLTAILYPLQDGEDRAVTLEIRRGGNDQWRPAAEAVVNPTGWTATFRVEPWDDTQSAHYRVTHSGGSRYEGLIRRNPRDKDEIVVGSLSCNSNTDRGPRADIVANLKAQDPDLLFFAGDQSYDHREHTAAFLLFGRQFGELTRDRPTVTIPDDHDVGHGNLWGEGGGVAKRPGGDDGGYLMSPDYVNMVQRAQASHLPDPFDPTPVKNGITVFYTSLNVGGIDFAIIEDRKWKTGPFGVVPQMGPRADHITDLNYDRRAIDVPEAELLGSRQLKFLHQWGQNWTNAEMKVVLSQTIFAGGAHLHGHRDNRLLADLDSNGWPQSGRAAALREIRRAFAFMMGGDQHLATVIHHGVNDWEDGGYSFCSPSIVNYYARWWSPLEEPMNHNANNPLPFTGRYHDGFGNKLTMHAYANPTPDNYNAAGYGLVRFKKRAREIMMECWPRQVDVTKPDARQFAGWPITIKQEDNYARKPIARLPTLRIKGQEDAVVQVIDEDNGEIVYTLRINGAEFRPKVFKAGTYTIKIGEGKQVQTLEQVQSVAEDDTTAIDVQL
jgi:hypothetical protein